MSTKSVFLSKTFWTQVLALASLLAPQVRGWVAANPVEFAAAWAALNILIRFATSGRVSILGTESPENGTAGGPGGFSLLVVMLAAGCLMGALPSCAPGQGMPIKATFQLEEGALSYSSKGGLEMEYRPGYGRMPDHYRNAPTVERGTSK